MQASACRPEEQPIREEPYCEPVGGEPDRFAAACRTQRPLLLKGPTVCGKTCFVEHRAWRLLRPLITV